MKNIFFSAHCGIKQTLSPRCDYLVVNFHKWQHIPALWLQSVCLWSRCHFYWSTRCNPLLLACPETPQRCPGWRMALDAGRCGPGQSQRHLIREKCSVQRKPMQNVVAKDVFKNICCFFYWILIHLLLALVRFLKMSSECVLYAKCHTWSIM